MVSACEGVSSKLSNLVDATSEPESRAQSMCLYTGFAMQPFVLCRARWGESQASCWASALGSQHRAMDRWSIGYRNKGLQFVMHYMTQLPKRPQSKVIGTACRVRCFNRKQFFDAAGRICIEKPGLSYRCSAAMASSHGHDRDDHGHDHGHGHHHAHGHHDHDHDHYPDNLATRAMRRFGLVQLASRIEHSGPLAGA